MHTRQRRRPAGDGPGGDVYLRLQIDGNETLEIPDERGLTTFAITQSEKFSIEGTVEERASINWDYIDGTHTFGGQYGEYEATINGALTQAVFDGNTIANQDQVDMSFVMDGVPDATVVVSYSVK